MYKHWCRRKTEPQPTKIQLEASKVLRAQHADFKKTTCLSSLLKTQVESCKHACLRIKQGSSWVTHSQSGNTLTCWRQVRVALALLQRWTTLVAVGTIMKLGAFKRVMKIMVQRGLTQHGQKCQQKRNFHFSLVKWPGCAKKNFGTLQSKVEKKMNPDGIYFKQTTSDHNRLSSRNFLNVNLRWCLSNRSHCDQEAVKKPLLQSWNTGTLTKNRTRYAALFGSV